MNKVDERIAVAVAELVTWQRRGKHVGRAYLAKRMGISVGRMSLYAPAIARAVRELDPTFEYHADDGYVWITSDVQLIKSSADRRWNSGNSQIKRAAAEYMTRARITREEHDWDVAIRAKLALDLASQVAELSKVA